ncbi:MAG: AbrB/MazE/SpoVT family DNA-binding domain-containing protein [Actinomycetota bacterium]|nr:AbrB/MazE/SpoVT family DNA-binding domain-containing protein [Actinomycetota bacterium]
MARVTLRAKGQLTLPEEIRRAAQLEVGDELEAELTDGGVLLRSQKPVDLSQAWYWTPDWQAGEREADAQHGARGGETFDSGEEFLAALQALVESNSSPG